MSRTLTPDTNLESLKKEAKAWLKALRAGDLDARTRLTAIVPDAPPEPGLRDIQLAIARDYGFAGWADLREALADQALTLRSPADLVDEALRFTWQNEFGAAIRIRNRFPDLSRHSIHAAVACGDLAEVKRRLAGDAEAAKARGGPNDWQPILYLAYCRLPGAEVHALEIANLLFDHGADPAARFSDDWENPFTLLGGVIGQGETGRPEHPLDEELVELFVARGTDPFDTQVLYDTSLQGDDVRWLDILWRHCEARGETDRWRNLERGIGGRYRRTALDYLLGNAVRQGHAKRVEWLLAHGADPNTLHSYSGRPVHVEAQLDGFPEIAALLKAHGAEPIALGGSAGFIAACMRHDLDTARAMAARDPDFLDDPSALIQATQRGFVDVVAFLLDLGMKVDLAPHDQKRALHWAAQCGRLEVAQLEARRGADVDRRGSPYKGTPLGFASHFGQTALIELLAPLSRDIFALADLGRIERLDAVLTNEPALVRERNPGGDTVLHTLPGDEELAVQVAELLLRHGADPRATNAKGDTAIEAARLKGMADLAEVLEAAPQV